MRKQEWLDTIVSLVNKTGTIYIQEIIETMKVSDMARTVQRDLMELEK